MSLSRNQRDQQQRVAKQLGRHTTTAKADAEHNRGQADRGAAWTHSTGWDMGVTTGDMKQEKPAAAPGEKARLQGHWEHMHGVTGTRNHDMRGGILLTR